jgi:serine/threonine-protein kinase
MADLDQLKAALADRYAIDREIGRGGMATVYLAEDLKHHRKVAVKVLRPELSASLGSERFLREIRIEASLEHPNIVPLHDSGYANGLPYYVMPYVEGESLRDLLEREEQLSLETALKIADSVAEGLEYAHRQDVVHRDIKPENILLAGERVMIADFGIARAASDAGGERLTATGVSIGTPEYMSPEQAAGDEKADVRTDIYALGCVLYEMLAGEPPFTGRTRSAILARQMQERVPSLEVVRHEVPSAV